MDLRIVYIQDVLTLRSVDIGETEVTAVGTDLSQAAEVLINGQPSPTYTIVSRNVVEAEIPESQLNETIRDVVVLSSSFTATDRSRITMQIGSHPQYLSGMMLLIQRYIKLLFRNPGSDILNPATGAGLGALVGHYLKGSQSVTPADIALAVSRAERQMIRFQARDSNLLDTERLASATLLGIAYSESTGAMVPRVALTSQAGQTAAAFLEY